MNDTSNERNQHAEHAGDQGSEQGNNVGKWIGAAVAGALLMYAFDPERGAARRARARGAVREAGHRTGDTLGNVWHHAEDRFDTARVRASKAYARANARLADAAHAAGERLAETSHRTRDRLEHARDRLSHVADDARERVSDAAHEARDRAEHAVDRARDRSSHLAHEARQRGEHAAERARERAHEVADRARERADTVAERARERGEYARERAERTGAQARDRLDAAADTVRANARDGAQLASSKFSEWTDQLAHVFGARSPTLTNSALLGTGALSVVGLVRRSPAAALLGLGALAVLLRSDRGRHMLSSLRSRGAGSASQVDVENAIHIDASPKEVFDAWSDVENFPRFMSHVTDVRDLGHRRSHWVVRGPGGMEYAWNAVMTEQTRPERLSWRSEPGSEIEQEGTITFEPSRGGTLVTVRMQYSPPAGVLGHGIAKMLGADPQRQMDDDLARMKAFIERGPNHPAAQPRAENPNYLH